MQSISLKELTENIERVIHQNFSMPIWVRAEISELRENNGHCYIELIEKESGSDHLIAKSRAVIWANVYRMLKPYFESQTGETLRSGLNVLVSVVVDYNGVYGFSLNIRDIDPVFTIGELAARRLEILHQLQRDGIVDMNKTLELPTLPQRLAIITSPTAAGYDDFINQLSNNVQQYVFYHKLFPAIMQGANTENSIIAALDRINEHIEHFDAVVIIRGGGATTDLSAFDSYNLALNCAQFPLPIITGIGHQRDKTILDVVAHTSVKTPTAAAEFLIWRLNEAENYLKNIVNNIGFIVNESILEQQHKIEQISMHIRHEARRGFYEITNDLSKKVFRLKQFYSNQIINERNKIEQIEQRINTFSPQFMLERGFTITTKRGKRINSKDELKKGDPIETHFIDGSIQSIIK